VDRRVRTVAIGSRRHVEQLRRRRNGCSTQPAA
jgi:hypothetical protein